MIGNLLVVDDEPITRHSLADILRLEGYNVAAAANGEEAVDHIRNFATDLIVLDLRMPGMGGMEVVKAVSQLSPDTEIVMLTAHGSMETAVDALRYRVHDYLIKPASPARILESVERGLARRAIKLEQHRAESGQILSQNVESMHLAEGILFDTSRRMIEMREEFIQLTPSECTLLKVLAENPGRVYSHRELVLFIQGREVSQKSAQKILRPLMSRLKQKLANAPELIEHLASVRSTGYIYK